MEIAKKILGLLKESLNFEQPAGDLEVNPIHYRKITASISKGEKLAFILPAFPAKSPNREKTLGDLPDLGELFALRKLNELCERISGAYPPGAEVMICSDGRVFSDLVLVSDENISEYTRAIESLISSENLRFLSVFHLDHALGHFHGHEDGVAGPEKLREGLLSQFAEPRSTIEERVRTEPAVRRLFNGMHRFVFEDRLVLTGTSGGASRSRETIRREAKDVAYELIRRSNAWSALLERQFPGAVRLSIHPQACNSEKLPIRLLPSDNHWRTPWHSVAFVEGTEVRLITRKEAQECGAQLYFYQGRYPYYGLNPIEAEGAHAGH